MLKKFSFISSGITLFRRIGSGLIHTHLSLAYQTATRMANTSRQDYLTEQITFSNFSGHTWQHSGLTPDSVLRDHSWWWLEII